MLETLLVTGVVGVDVNVLSEVVEVGLVRVVEGEDAIGEVAGVVAVVVEFEATGAGDEVTVGAGMTVVGLTVTVPPLVIGAVLVKIVRSSVLLAMDTVGDVAVWGALNKELTEVLVLPVDVGRVPRVLAGMIAVIGVLWVEVPTTAGEAVILVTDSTAGSEAAVASTMLGVVVVDPLLPVKEGRGSAELVLPATEFRI